MNKEEHVRKYRPSAQYRLWLQYYTNRNNAETFNNATKSALKAYNTTSYHNAGHIGHENYKKLQFLSSNTADLLGYGVGRLISIGIKKALKGSFKDWDRLMVRLGYFEDSS